MAKHKHQTFMVVDVPHNPDRKKEFCRCGFLRYRLHADQEQFRYEYTPWQQAEKYEDIMEYLTEMALAKDRH